MILNLGVIVKIIKTIALKTTKYLKVNNVWTLAILRNCTIINRLLKKHTSKLVEKGYEFGFLQFHPFPID